MKEISSIMKFLEKEDISGQTAKPMTGNGTKTRCMDMEH